MLANTNIEVVLEMPFFSLSNADVEFAEKPKKLTLRFYTAVEALPTTNWVELIARREFAKITLDRNSKTFVVNMLNLKATEGVHFSWAA